MCRSTCVDGPLSSPFEALKVVSGLGRLSPSFWMMLSWCFSWRQLWNKPPGARVVPLSYAQLHRALLDLLAHSSLEQFYIRRGVVLLLIFKPRVTWLKLPFAAAGEINPQRAFILTWPSVSPFFSKSRVPLPFSCSERLVPYHRNSPAGDAWNVTLWCDVEVVSFAPFLVSPALCRRDGPGSYPGVGGWQ
eukprot:785356-Amphidinium_carterae.1